MNASVRRARLRAAGTALLLVLIGAILGITADRRIQAPASAGPTPLTADAMAAHLGLSPEAEARLRALVDTLNVGVVAAMADGPGALMAATHDAHMRIEASLPEESRPAFHAWMQEQHAQMMGRMHEMGTGAGGAGHGPGGP